MLVALWSVPLSTCMQSLQGGTPPPHCPTVLPLPVHMIFSSFQFPHSIKQQAFKEWRIYSNSPFDPASHLTPRIFKWTPFKSNTLRQAPFTKITVFTWDEVVHPSALVALQATSSFTRIPLTRQSLSSFLQVMLSASGFSGHTFLIAAATSAA